MRIVVLLTLVLAITNAQSSEEDIVLFMEGFVEGYSGWSVKLSACVDDLEEAGSDIDWAIYEFSEENWDNGFSYMSNFFYEVIDAFDACGIEEDLIHNLEAFAIKLASDNCAVIAVLDQTWTIFIDGYDIYEDIQTLIHNDNYFDKGTAFGNLLKITTMKKPDFKQTVRVEDLLPSK